MHSSISLYFECTIRQARQTFDIFICQMSHFVAEISRISIVHLVKRKKHLFILFGCVFIEEKGRKLKMANDGNKTKRQIPINRI